jgi:histidine triad (HIT) family protein
MTETIFQQIIDKEINADIVYEDDKCLAFHDLNPQAPTHVLLIPKKSITKLREVTSEDASLLGHLMLKATEIAKDLNLADDFRIVINNGRKACQSVFHLHLHILGGRLFSWPPG